MAQCLDPGRHDNAVVGRNMRRPAVAADPPPPTQLGILSENSCSGRCSTDGRGAAVGESVAAIGAVIEVELGRHGAL